MNQLLLRYDGTDVPYGICDAHFDVVGDAFDFCIELELADQDNEDVPREVMIRLTNLERTAGTDTLHVRAQNDFCSPDYYDRPNAFVYSGFHHSHVSAWVDIQSNDESELVAQIRVVTDDVNCYDERARDNNIAGTCKFARKPKSEMWGP
jgi:hypothetical protein